MKVGDIIRRKLHTGTLIGQYIKVTETVDGIPTKGIYINGKREFTINLADKFVKIKTVHLKVPIEDFNNIRKNQLRIYRHEVNKEWLEVLDKKGELLALRTNKGDYMYFKGFKFERRTRLKTVTKAVTKFERDIQLRETYIKLTVDSCIWIDLKE